MRSLDGRTILVTGATDGIGRGTAGVLARRGAQVLLHGRNPEKLAAVADRIARDTGRDRVATCVADFASLDAVRHLADVVRRNHDAVHVLVNNAGIGTVDGDSRGRRVSADGHELRFQVNHLAPFLLTHLLLPVLKRGAPARVVNVTSAAQTEIDFDDVMLERDYDGFRAYAQSKLAMVMATLEFARRVDPAEVTVNCVHPGSLLDTKMVREGFGTPRGPVETGIDSELNAATNPALEGVTGIYLEETHPAEPHPQAADPAARRRLWELSERLTGLTPDPGG